MHMVFRSLSSIAQARQRTAGCLRNDRLRSL